MRTNDPDALSRRNVPRYGPENASWASEPPPTEPALPPIRSSRPSRPLAPTDSAAMPPRALVMAQRTVKRDALAAQRDDERDLVLADATDRPGDTANAPMIIPGDGKPAALRPVLRRVYPRSRKTHVALIALAGIIVLAALFAVTPLTAGATGYVGNFLATGNAFALPTAQPTATPVPRHTGTGGNNGNGANPGTQAVMDDIRAVFGPTYAPGALNIARCESGYDPNAWNRIAVMGSHAEGVFQILYPITWNSTSYSGYSPYNYHENILAAHQIFTRDGNSWREWACKSY